MGALEGVSHLQAPLNRVPSSVYFHLEPLNGQAPHCLLLCAYVLWPHHFPSAPAPQTWG